MESILEEFYETLEQLRYPELARIDAKDFSIRVLTGENRIKLLSWLLSRASPTLCEHLQHLNGPTLKEEVVKCYSQMGICTKEKALLGNCSMKQQIPVFKALISFINSFETTETDEIDVTRVDEILAKHLNETADSNSAVNNIKKFVRAEKSKLDANGDKSTSTIRTELTIDKPNQIQLSDDNEKKETSTGQKLEFDSAVALFGKAFESELAIDNSKLEPPSVQIPNMDETFRNLHTHLRSVITALKAKEFISAVSIPQDLEKCETPLCKAVEENVILLEEMTYLLDECEISNNGESLELNYD